MTRNALLLSLSVGLVGCEAAESEPLPPRRGDAGPAVDLGFARDAGPPSPACARRLDPGNCLAAFPRFTFDPDLGQCVEVTWGGCGDNPNNYPDHAACRAACAPPAPPPPPPTPPPSLPPPPEACAERLDPGPCQAAFRRFTFDPDLGRCREVIWGGCGDNPNNYPDLASCALSCEPSSACGGLVGRGCGATEYCEWEPDSCGAADELGVCRARPAVCPDVWSPVCGCDGQTYGNDCEAHAHGVDVAATGECSGGCQDASSDPILVSATITFESCQEECQFLLRVERTNTPVEPSCDIAELVVRGSDRGPPSRESFGVLTPAGHAAVREVARALEGAHIEETYGCPGCDDGGIAGLTIVRRGVARATRYKLGSPPDLLVDADRLAQGILQSLNLCEPSPFVRISSACFPPRR